MNRVVIITSLLIGLGSIAGAEESESWTVARLAEHVNDTIQRFDTVVLNATYTQKRNANALTRKDPLVIEGSGTLHYRGDQERWFLRNDGFSFRAGSNETFPRVTITGYDGSIHYTGNDRVLKLGEEGFRTTARPKQLLWETMLTYEYLGKAFDRESSKIAFSGHDDDGRHVVDLESTWGTQSDPWRLRVRFDIKHSFLPITQRLWYRDKPYATSRLNELTPVPGSSHWYPRSIHTQFHAEALGIMEQRHEIEEFRLPDSLDDAEFEYEPPPGTDVIDRRSNLVWHSDPWWDALMPWMGTQLGWPRYAFQWLGEFQSYADESIGGQPAPPIQAAHWIGENPGRWDRKDRAFTVIYFCGDASRLIDPHPRWTTELGQFANLVEPIGGEVIGIATADTPAADLQKASQELMIRFPFAIDQPSGGDRRGKSHIAFGLQHYYSVVVVDSSGKVHLLGTGDEGLVPTIEKLISKEDAQWLAEQLNVDPHLQRDEADQIKTEWIKLRNAADGRGTISGKVDPSLGGVIELVPQFKMLMGSNPGGYLVIRDDGGRRNVEANAETGAFAFEQLPRGRYELRYTDGNGNKQTAVVVLTSDDGTASRDFGHP